MAYTPIVSTDTRQQAWAKDQANVAEKQDILAEGAFVDGDKTRLDQLGSDDSPAFNAMTLTGANTLSLGTSSTNDGSLLIKNSTDANWFTLTSGETTTSYSWILPLVASGGDNYLINVDADGTMGYTDPASLGAAPEGTAVLSTGETGGTKYLREDGDGTCSWQTPSGAGDLLADGTVPLTADWDVGAFSITALRFISDQATGTSPFTVASTTVVTNLNADTVDGIEGANITTLDGTQTVTGDKTFSGSTTLGALAGLVLTDGSETMTADTFDFASNRTLLVGDYDSQWPAEALLTTSGLLGANTVDSDQYVDGSIDLVHMSTDSVDYTKTTGSIKSLTPVTDAAADFAANFTGANLYGGTFLCDVTGTIQLPAVAVGMNFTIITVGAIAVVVEPNASDNMILDGVQLDDADSATNLSTSGDIIFFQYHSAAGWVASSNGWTDED